MVSKVNRVQLKSFIKKCVREVLAEDPDLGRRLVKEAIVDMFGERMLVTEAAPGRTQRSQGRSRPAPTSMRRPKPTSTNIPAVQRGNGGPTDLFESLAADTLENTLPQQVAGDRASPKSYSPVEFLASPMAADDSPNRHLQQAAMMEAQGYMPSPTPGQLAAQRSRDARVQQVEQRVAQHPPPQPQVQLPNEPSQSQLEAMYRQQQRDAGASAGEQHPVSQVPDDLAILGLGNKTWDVDAHVGGSTQAESSRGESAAQVDPVLAQIAAEMNAGQ